MAQKGLLTPVEAVNAARGLLHTPDLMMQLLMDQGLLSASARPGGGASSPYHPIGARKLEKPVKEMEFTRVPSGAIKRPKLISPADLQGGLLLPGIGDRLATASKITWVGGKPVAVDLPGGGGYMRTPEGGVWASELGPSSRLSKDIAKLEETGKPVYLTHTTMGPRAVDFQHALSEQVLQVLPQSKITRAGKQAFKERMFEGVVDGGKRVRFDTFPGIDSPKLRGWLNESGQNRKWFIKLMEGKKFRDQGFPNIPEMRLAATEKAQLNLPEYASGANIARVRSGLLGSGHPSFPVGTPGEYVGGFGGYYPMELMFPKAYAAVKGAANPRRAFQMGGYERAQPMNQQWVDTLMPLYERGLLLPGR